MRATAYNLLLLSFLLLFHCSISSTFLNEVQSIFYNPRTLKVGYLAIKGKIDDSEELYFAIKKFERDKAIDAIIIVLDSNGGFTGSGHRIANIIRRVCKKKPMVAFVIRDALSAAYNIASSCSWIVAQVTANIGGIGTTMSIPKKNDSFSFGSGKFKNVIYTSEGLLDKEYAEYIQAKIDQAGAVAYQLVADNRGLSFEFIKGLESRYYRGEDALSLGLIDQVGEFEDALAKIIELVQLCIDTSFEKIQLLSLSGTLLTEYEVRDLKCT